MERGSFRERIAFDTSNKISLAIPTGWGDRQEGPQTLVRNCTQVVQMRLRVTSEENKEVSFRNNDTKRDR